MANNKKKEKKKVARVKIAKARVLSRRKKIKEANSLEKKQAKYAHKFREKLQPVINDPEKKKAMEESKEKALREKLEQNAEMLKYLEEQYESDAKESGNIEDIVDAAKKVQLLNDSEAVDSVESITLEEPEEGWEYN